LVRDRKTGGSVLGMHDFPAPRLQQEGHQIAVWGVVLDQQDFSVHGLASWPSGLKGSMTLKTLPRPQALSTLIVHEQQRLVLRLPLNGRILDLFLAPTLTSCALAIVHRDSQGVIKSGCKMMPRPRKEFAMPHAFAATLKTFKIATGKTGKFFSLPELARQFPKVARLPVAMRIVLESVLRNCDGQKVTAGHVRQLANWFPNADRTDEIPFVVARVILQDFTGVP